MTTYYYHGISYTYADLQTARKRQNALFHAAFERGDFAESSKIFDTDPREFLPQIYGTPERSEPEQIETGDKKTLTAPTKCCIIRIARRVCRRVKRRYKAMKNAEAAEIASRIANSDTWIPEDCEKLCSLAGLAEDWKNADGETFETVVYKAAEILGVEI